MSIFNTLYPNGVQIRCGGITSDDVYQLNRATNQYERVGSGGGSGAELPYYALSDELYLHDEDSTKTLRITENAANFDSGLKKSTLNSEALVLNSGPYVSSIQADVLYIADPASAVSIGSDAIHMEVNGETAALNKSKLDTLTKLHTIQEGIVEENDKSIVKSGDSFKLVEAPILPQYLNVSNINMEGGENQYNSISYFENMVYDNGKVSSMTPLSFSVENNTTSALSRLTPDGLNINKGTGSTLSSITLDANKVDSAQLKKLTDLSKAANGVTATGDKMMVQNGSSYKLLDVPSSGATLPSYLKESSAEFTTTANNTIIGNTGFYTRTKDILATVATMKNNSLTIGNALNTSANDDSILTTSPHMILDKDKLTFKANATVGQELSYENVGTLNRFHNAARISNSRTVSDYVVTKYENNIVTSTNLFLGTTSAYNGVRINAPELPSGIKCANGLADYSCLNPNGTLTLKSSSLPEQNLTMNGIQSLNKITTLSTTTDKLLVKGSSETYKLLDIPSSLTKTYKRLNIDHENMIQVNDYKTTINNVVTTDKTTYPDVTADYAKVLHTNTAAQPSWREMKGYQIKKDETILFTGNIRYNQWYVFHFFTQGKTVSDNKEMIIGHVGSGQLLVTKTTAIASTADSPAVIIPQHSYLFKVYDPTKTKMDFYTRPIEWELVTEDYTQFTAVNPSNVVVTV